MKLSFYGGVRTVTGANYLLEINKLKVLIDCGLFQGSRFCEEQNFSEFPYNPKEINYLLLTHAHTDHAGRIPKLYQDGFRGIIFATRPTCEFAEISFLDSAGIMKEESERQKDLPLYTEKSARETLKLFKGIDYEERIKLSPSVSFQFKDAGHILGSAIIEVKIEDKGKEKIIVFSGDLGNHPAPLIRDPQFIEKADYVVIESTYGDQIHESEKERKDLLEDAIEETIAQGGVLIIPTFAIERTQEVLYELNELVENHRIPPIPIFIDSPLAIKATEIYKKYPDYYDKEAVYLIESGDQLFKFPGLRFSDTVEESKAINDIPPPKVIIAGSGMSTGGRILHHERRYLQSPNNFLLLVSYQAKGTLGRKLFEGAKEVVVFGDKIPVKAKARAIGSYSSHADQKMLLDWLDHIQRPIQKVFVVQGEEEPTKVLTQEIRDHLGLNACAPKLGDSFEL